MTTPHDGLLAGGELPLGIEELLDGVQAWFQSHPEDQETRRTLIGIAHSQPRGDDAERSCKARPISDISGTLPTGILWAHGLGGAVATRGTVTVFSGAGGVGKSTFEVALAVGMAHLPDDQPGTVVQGVFQGLGGPVLLATYEDEPEVTAYRVRKLVASRYTESEDQDRVLSRVHVIDMLGHPLFGPVGADGRTASYNTPPGRLRGWADLWAEVRRIRPQLVIIDPALAAFSGDSNAVGPVREFLSALALQARDVGVGVLLIAHSNKSSRKSDGDPYEPGLVGGSAAWADGGRGVVTMTRTGGDEDGASGGLQVAIAKSNYGAAFIKCALEEIRAEGGAIIGFTGSGGWSGPGLPETNAYSGKVDVDAFKR